MKNIYKRHRFPPSVIQYAVRLYYRFNLSVRDVEDILAKRNISMSYEAIGLWVNKLDPKMGPMFARRLKRDPGFGDTYFLDEVFVKICGKQHYLWRAVGQDGVPSLDGALLMFICKNERMRKQPSDYLDGFLDLMVCQQSSRALSSTNSSEGAWDEEV